MKRKPLEKLSERLIKLFLSRVEKYNYFYFGMLTSTTKTCMDYRPIDLAKKMSKNVMDMIAEYELEQNTNRKIKRMAWELFKENLLDTDKEPGMTMEGAFEIAEEFYNYAKEKEQGNIE